MKQFYSVIMKFLNTVDTKKLFVESDAWWLFKYSALSEVIGWTLLIYGIVAPYYRLPGFTFMLAIGGSIHGMLFIAYIGILAATYSSLGWTRGKALIGLFVSALPYGTFFFEQWAVHARRAFLLGSYRKVVVRAIIRRSKSILVFQSSNSTSWQLPGGSIRQNESLDEGLVRIIKERIGLTIPIVPFEKHVYLDGENKQVEFLFEITDLNLHKGLDLRDIVNKNGDIDEMQFVDLDTTPDTAPALTYLKEIS